MDGGDVWIHDRPGLSCFVHHLPIRVAMAMTQDYIALALLVVATAYISSRLIGTFKPKKSGCGCGGCGCSGKEKTAA